MLHRWHTYTCPVMRTGPTKQRPRERRIMCRRERQLLRWSGSFELSRLLILDTIPRRCSPYPRGRWQRLKPHTFSNEGGKYSIFNF